MALILILVFGFFVSNCFGQQSVMDTAEKISNENNPCSCIQCLNCFKCKIAELNEPSCVRVEDTDFCDSNQNCSHVSCPCGTTCKLEGSSGPQCNGKLLFLKAFKVFCKVGFFGKNEKQCKPANQSNVKVQV